jgi:hypothetical protein
VPRLLSTDKKEVSQCLQWTRCRRPAPLHGDDGPNCDHGRDNGLLSHTWDKETIKTVGEKGTAWAHKGKSPCQSDKANSHSLFWLKGPYPCSHFPKGQLINASIIVSVMDKFLRHLRQ